MSLLGPEGLARVAENNMALTRYVERITALKGVELLNNAPRPEVALRLPKPAAEAMTPKGAPAFKA